MIGIKDLEIVLDKNKNDQINRKIQDFVDKMSEKKQSASYYSKNRNVKFEKAIEDIFLGKKAEFFTSLILNKYFNYPFQEPDLEVRKSNKKNWDVDLSNLNIHVKSCSAKTFKFCKDWSWTFQYSNNSGKNGKDKLFNRNNEDLISLIYLENPFSDTGIIKAILPWSKIYPLLKDPIKPTLIGLKKCLYYKDL